jgi:hypothetical protein
MLNSVLRPQRIADDCDCATPVCPVKFARFRMTKPARFLIPALPVLLGIALLAFYGAATKRASRTNGWLQAVGFIEKATVRDGGADLVYRFEAGGAVHRNPNGTITDGSGRQAVAARYRAGRQVLVYVNPANAAESVLEHPRNPHPWPLIAGPILIIVGISLAIFFIRQPALLGAQKQAAARKAAPPMSRLRPPPAIKRT